MHRFPCPWSASSPSWPESMSPPAVNPVPEMLALGPYAGGLAVASRRRAAAELEARARDLEEEREIFAEQSVRYERARIARELHDIVAHSVSLMVVQANAGERLATLDPAGAAEAFTSIGEAARQAEAEIDRLVELLNDTVPGAPSPGLRIVEELVARAHASGLAITCQLRGDVDDLCRRRGRYRVSHGARRDHERHEARPRGSHGSEDQRRRRRGRGPGCQQRAATRILGPGTLRRRPRSRRHARAGDRVRWDLRRRTDAGGWVAPRRTPAPPRHEARDRVPGRGRVPGEAVYQGKAVSQGEAVLRGEGQ